MTLTLEQPNHSLEQEQAAFESALPELLKTHSGEFALFKGGQPHGFFESFEEAYAAALKRFGVDTIFLIARVEPPKPLCTSLSWTAGVMFSDME